MASSSGQISVDLKLGNAPAPPPKKPTSKIKAIRQPLHLSPNRSSNALSSPPPANIVSPPSFTIGSEKLLSFDRANNVINTLVATVNSQQQQIQALQHHQSSTVDRSELSNIAKTLTNSIKALDDRVRRLEGATKLSSRDPESVGYVVNSNRRALARSMDVISSKVSTSDLVAVQESISLSINAASTSLRDTLASRTTMDKAVDVVSSMSQKVQVLEKVLHGKVDTTDFEGFKMDAITVREKARELGDLLGRVDYLEKSNLEQGGRLRSVEDVAVKNEGRTVLINEGLKSKAGGKEMEELRGGVEEIRRIVDKVKADKKDLSRVETVLSTQGSVLESVNSTLHTLSLSTGTLEDSLSNLTAGTVTKGELKKIVGGVATRSMLSDAVARVMASVEGKAWNKDVISLTLGLETVSSTLAKTARKADLAGEFVEWYGRKGEALEGNLAAVDKHLERLAVKARAEVKRS
ncbi:hypothetical protein TrRE_jg12149 [Triparma retinervis]|uniref:Uncharacterized protein n=1 Tax=Triparma retinervis TaxID=2557542 RepID=A0A9W7APS2_9STRA|nr:hypothetical protein TrRE_jg12149 [Triparma retinervis]